MRYNLDKRDMKCFEYCRFMSCFIHGRISSNTSLALYEFNYDFKMRCSCYCWRYISHFDMSYTVKRGPSRQSYLDIYWKTSYHSPFSPSFFSPLPLSCKTCCCSWHFIRWEIPLVITNEQFITPRFLFTQSQCAY